MGIENYREIIESILTEQAREEGEDKAVETQLAFDRERDRYLMFHVGWLGERRIYGCVVHIDLKEDKIWIQNDGIEIGIANELIAAGIPKSDIVLGFRSPYMRQFIDLAAG